MTDPSHRLPPSRRALPWAVALVLVLTLLGVALQAAQPAGTLPILQRRILQAALVVNLGAFLLRGWRDGARRWGWWGFAGAVACHLGATLARDHLSHLGLTLAVVIYLPLGAVGFLGWRLGVRRWRRNLRQGLEGLIFSLSLLAVAWLSIQDLPGARIDRLWWAFLEVGFPALLLGLAMYQVRMQPEQLAGPLGWVGLSLLVSNLENVWQLRLILEGRWSSAHPLGLLDPMIPLLASVAAFAPWPREQRARSQSKRRQLLSGLAVYLPFLATQVGILWEGLNGVSASPFLLWLLGLTSFCILGRQVLALRDQATFSRTLQTRLDEQRAVLEAREEALLRTQRLNLVATVGAGLAHDLNNQLARLCALVEGGGAQEDIVASAHRAAALARKTMAHAGAPGARRELFDLHEHLLGFAPMLHRLLGPGISLQVDATPGEVWMEADPLEVEQVLVNLATNARDAMEGKGTLWISLDLEGDRVRLEVQDDGPGIPEPLRAKVLDPFFTTKAKGQGTGLGLPSVQAFVEGLGGHLELRSGAGRGATFVLTWPKLKDL